MTHLRRPEATAETFPDGALRSGDIGFMDERGRLYAVDRKKDMTDASGFKVWPREVEDVLHTHPAVREAGIAGVSDGYCGETVKASISLRPGAETDPDAITAHCKERLAACKSRGRRRSCPTCPGRHVGRSSVGNCVPAPRTASERNTHGSR